MALASDFQVFMDPQEAWRDKRWQHVIHEKEAAYKRCFFVHGMQQAAKALGFSGARALWLDLEATSSGTAADASPRVIRSPAPPILAAVPSRWRSDLPDINDRGNAPAHTTYWREFSLPKLSEAWRGKAITLPKALLAIAALAVAAERKGFPSEDFAAGTNVHIRSSLYWLVGYSAALHDQHIAADLTLQRAAYAACGLEFEFGPNDYSDALQQAADGKATLTLATAKLLQRWLNNRGAACGPILINLQDIRRIKVAVEVFADVNTQACCGMGGTQHNR